MGSNRLSAGRSGTIRFDVLAAVLGLVIALLLVPLRFFAAQVFIKTIPLFLGAACGLYLLAVYRDEYRNTLPGFPSAVTFSLPSLVIVGLTAMVLLVAQQGVRSVGFFALAAATGSLVILQILFARERDFHAGILLFQIVCFAFVFRFSALYATPGLIGIDIWTHVTGLADPIYQEGSLQAIADNKHYTSPFYHLLVVAAAHLYEVPLRAGLYLSLGLVMPLSILLVYATTNLLVPGRWAVLAATLYAIGDYVMLWGIHLIPTSLGLVFFLAILYILVRIMRIEFAGRDFALLVLLSVAVILTHQVSTFIMLVLLGSAFLAQVAFKLGPFGFHQLNPDVYRAQRPVNMIGLVVFDFGFTIFMWSLTPFRRDTFLATVLTWFQETLAEGAGFLNLASPGATGDDGGGAAAGPTVLDQVVQYLDVLGFLLLLGFTFAGCLYVIHRERTQQSVFTLLLATAVMLVFVLGLPIFGIRNFIPGRWFAFLYAPMAILAVIGVRHFARRLGTGTVLACLLVLALVYPAGMVLASPSSPDNPVFSNHHEQLAYNEAELAAVSTIREMTGGPGEGDIRPDQILYTDHPYQTVFRRTGTHYAEAATINESEPVDHRVTVYRSAQSTEATFFRDASGVGRIHNVEEERICRPVQASVYANGDVTMCTASPALN